MGAHHHVHRALPQAVEDRGLLLRRAKAAQQLDLDGERLHALAERLEVLKCQHRRRGQDGRLLAVHKHLEDCPYRHLGFAEADVAADEAVHRLGLF